MLPQLHAYMNIPGVYYKFGGSGGIEVVFHKEMQELDPWAPKCSLSCLLMLLKSTGTTERERSDFIRCNGESSSGARPMRRCIHISGTCKWMGMDLTVGPRNCHGNLSMGNQGREIRTMSLYRSWKRCQARTSLNLTSVEPVKLQRSVRMSKD